MIPQKVFEYFSANHGLLLLESEYEDIKNIMKSEDTCTWYCIDSDGEYETECKNEFESISGDLYGLNFCPFCGKKIETEQGKDAK
jgi:hypothetical protein